MMKKLFVITFLAAMLNFIPAAHAEPQCNTRDSVLSQLKEKYNEVPVNLGVTHNGGLIEVIASPEGKSWSILITSPQGMSCLVAAGEGWRMLTPIDPASLGNPT